MKRCQMKIVLLILVAFIVAINEGKEVEQRTLQVNGLKKTYYLITDYKTWNSAQSHCEGLQANLLVINSVEEAEEIRSWMKLSIPEEIAVFIGFHDQIVEGDYVTIYGEPLEDAGFYYWGFQQPDDYNGEEDCGAFRADGFLADVSCEANWYFFCESEAR